MCAHVRNQEVYQILTKNCRYLLINYRLAELIVRVSHIDRKNILQRGREAFEKYLSLLDHYEILSSADRRLYQTYIESPSTFSTISTTDPNARREAKIANFKLEKELKSKLEVSLHPQYHMPGKLTTYALVFGPESCVSTK